MTTLPPETSFWRRNRRRLAATVLLALAVGVPLLSARRERQPAYQGRLLMDWAADLAVQNTARSAAAREAIVALGPQAVPTLIRTVRRPDPALAGPLIRVGRYLPLATYQTLCDWVKPTANATARSHALRALALLGPVAEPAVPTLARITRAPPPNQRVTEWMQATQALGKIGRAAVAPLLDAFTNAPDHLRVHPLLAFAEVGPAAAEAIPAVLAVFTTKPNAEWSALAGFLCAAGGETTLPQFLQHLDSPDPVLQFKASEVLYQMAECSSAVRDGLIAAGGTQPTRVRFEVVRALGRLSATRGVVARFMIHALQDPDEGIRLEGAVWLRERLSPAAISYLLANESAGVQARARQVLDTVPGSASPVP